MGAQQPFMYEAIKRNDDRFPTSTFDPKAVTRASYEKKKPKPKPNGPLVSINRHPDAHMVPSGRSKFRPMGRKTKGWIKGMRVVQLCLRILEAVGAVGLVVVMSLIGLMGWVMGATLGVVILHCLYSIFHHARPAGSRAPGTSAAYQIFSAVSDLCILPLYAYGTITTKNTTEAGKDDKFANVTVARYMVPSVYYGLIAAGGLHLLSMIISLWLAIMFRRISSMPPDMNPLEANLTSRVHKRNKSSVATTSTYTDSEKRDSRLYDDASRPPSIPFMHTRQNSETSFTSRDSRVNLPSRQYQIAAGNRSSATTQDLKRMSAPPSATRASYTEIPLGETGASPARPISMYSGPDGRPSSGSSRAEPASPGQNALPRAPKFTETWYASDSLISRTQKRTRAMNSNTAAAQNQRYESLRQNLDASDDSDAENGAENIFDYYNYRAAGANTSPSSPPHPNPLRSNPTAAPSSPTTSSSPSPTKSRRPRTPFSRLRASVLSEVSLNGRRVSGSQDITDSALKPGAGWEPRNRLSSIQPESDFYSKPYGELKPGTPPVMVGSNRQVSSGNDYDLGVLGAGKMGRRHVSGREAEEGRAGRR
ncbi:hypothetical protein VTI74DRAFT_28 [Chaetomium olivicolor]